MGLLLRLAFLLAFAALVWWLFQSWWTPGTPTRAEPVPEDPETALIRARDRLRHLVDIASDHQRRATSIQARAERLSPIGESHRARRDADLARAVQASDDALDEIREGLSDIRRLALRVGTVPWLADLEPLLRADAPDALQRVADALDLLNQLLDEADRVLPTG